MADVTISSLLAATPSTNAVIPFSESNSTNKVNINSIVGLTTNGTYRGAIQRGSYGSLTIGGSNNGWSGIDFTDASSTFMVRNSDGLAGIFKTNNTWAWYFDGSGALVTGSVPWANVSGKPSFATVATTGSYTDLINKPTIPASPASQQLARAWVNFDGQGAISTNQTIRASYNVDSVSKLGTGDYRINFTSGTFSDANYCAVGNGGRGVNAGWYGIAQSRELPTASTFRYVNYNGSNVGEDPVYAYFVFYR